MEPKQAKTRAGAPDPDDLSVICICGDPPERHHTAAVHNDWIRRYTSSIRRRHYEVGQMPAGLAKRLGALEAFQSSRTVKRG